MKIIREYRALIIDIRLTFIKKKISKLLNESIQVHYNDLDLVCRNTFAVINGQPIDKKKYEKNDQRIVSINQEVVKLMKKQLRLTYHYLELR